MEDDDYYANVRQIKANKSGIFVPLAGETGQLQAWRKQRRRLQQTLGHYTAAQEKAFTTRSTAITQRTSRISAQTERQLRLLHLEKQQMERRAKKLDQQNKVKGWRLIRDMQFLTASSLGNLTRLNKDYRAKHKALDRLKKNLAKLHDEGKELGFSSARVTKIEDAHRM